MYPEILRATGHYSDTEVALFERAVTIRHVAKQEFLLRKGEVARHIYYLSEGAARQYDIIGDGEEITTDLHVAGEWFLNYESLIGQRPAKVHMQAFSDSKIISLSLEAVHHLTAKSVSFLQLNRVLEGAFTKMQFLDQPMTPLEKYRFILDQRPGLILAFPLKMIASFLKMSPETLSRVRSAAAKGTIS